MSSNAMLWILSGLAFAVVYCGGYLLVLSPREERRIERKPKEHSEYIRWLNSGSYLSQAARDERARVLDQVALIAVSAAIAAAVRLLTLF